MGILEQMRDLLINIDKNVQKIADEFPDPPPNKEWPNEPKNFVQIADWNFSESPNGLYGDDPIGDTGWKIVNNVPPGTIWPPGNEPFTGTPRGYCLGIEVNDAPYSPKKVYDFVYPEGMRLGTAPSTVYKMFAGVREIYCAWWSRLSDPYDFSTNGQKMTYIWNENKRSYITIAPDQRTMVHPEYPGGDGYNHWPNCPESDIRLFTPGKWHLTECHLKLPEASAEGSILRWWLDGVLQGDYSDIWSPKPIDMFQVCPVFGGNGDVYKTQEDHWLADHVYISVPKL